MTLCGHLTHPIYPPPPSSLPLRLAYLKDRKYENNPQTISYLKTANTARIRAIPIEECVCVTDNFACNWQVCLQRQGGPLEHILERTKNLDYLTYKLESSWNDHAQTEVNVHQTCGNSLKTCQSY